MDWGSRPEQFGPRTDIRNRAPRDVFDELRIGLASPDQVRSWSFGEVRKPETINYRTLKPEKEGLFDERIFGPQKDWECACGKFKRIRYRGIVCEKCGVEVTRSKVRRERMGHVELAAPVTHIWFFKGVPSRLGYLLDMSPKELEKVIYFAAYVITDLDERKRLSDLPELRENKERELEVVKEEFAEWKNSRLEQLEQQVQQMEEGGAKPSEITKRRAEVEAEIKDHEERCAEECELIEEAFKCFSELKTKQLVDREPLWRALTDRYDPYFSGGMGAEAVKSLLAKLDLDDEMEKLQDDIRQSSSIQRRTRAAQRIKVVKPFWEGKHSPKSMIIEAVPVIPPELRPMVQLDGGRFAASDLNDLYRRVINRNNRLKRLLDLAAPEIIVNNEKRMLQEAVDALFDNGRRGKAVTGQGNRPLKSLSDMLKGKQGRFRQNLLGKRVDYSARSVIVVGPQLALHQCGLPKVMALELFKPFVMKRLADRDLAPNIKSAKRMVERQLPQVWDVLKEVIQEHPVLLNRAPTLHRLGIQAFEPVLVEGKAIQIHPLVCEAFNADFDGDQMAVHLPLSAEAQAEARILMLSTNNVLSPASGRPIVTPSQDMVIGIYYLSMKEDEDKDAKEEPRRFSDIDEAVMAYDLGQLPLHAPIRLRMGGAAGDPLLHAEMKDFIPALITKEPVDGGELMETTLGRALLNHALPADFPLIDERVLKGDLKKLIEGLIERYDKNVVQRTLDRIKELGFEYSTRAGLTIGLSDVITPPDREAIIERYDKEADKHDRNYQKGVITQEELHEELVEVWNKATGRVTDSVQKSMREEQFNPIDMMVSSGARGNRMQVRQIAGMRGLVADAKGDIIPRPIKSNYRQGLTVLEYFIAAYGARKGLTDTALRTADAGYLTRRLVDVAQEIIVRDEDSEDRGIRIPIRKPGGELVDRLHNRIFGRVLVDDVMAGGSLVETKDGRRLEAGEVIDRRGLVALEAAEEVMSVRVRSPLTDEIRHGISRASYGLSMATGKMAEPGEAVGIMAAQSIGEPGTQLTMRNFHIGGAGGAAVRTRVRRGGREDASRSGGSARESAEFKEVLRFEIDITHGLPRVVELFEARAPKGKATLSEVSGRVRIEDDEEGRRVIVVEASDGEHAYEVASWARPAVRNLQEITAGTPLTEGPLDPKEVCDISGVKACQQYLVEQVQEVYRSQGVDIHDKHIELIVRQMLRKVRIVNANDSEFLPHQLVDQGDFRAANRGLVAEGKRPAEGRPELMGITKASLSTDSWLSAASFQETTRVLTEAAINGRSDYLRGLKENVIIGKLIPAGTGAARYQALEPHLPEADALPPGLGADWLASLQPPGAGNGGRGLGEDPEDPADAPEPVSPLPPSADPVLSS